MWVQKKTKTTKNNTFRPVAFAVQMCRPALVCVWPLWRPSPPLVARTKDHHCHRFLLSPCQMTSLCLQRHSAPSLRAFVPNTHTHTKRKVIGAGMNFLKGLRVYCYTQRYSRRWWYDLQGIGATEFFGVSIFLFRYFPIVRTSLQRKLKTTAFMFVRLFCSLKKKHTLHSV